MIQEICFKNKGFNQNNNTLFDLTNNVIILCDRAEIKDTLFREVMRICRGECEASTETDYWTDHCNQPEITRMEISYLPTSVFCVDKSQKISITVEMPYILQMTEINDLWFVVKDKNDHISIYPLACFEKVDKTWDKGVWEIYRWTADGRYGGDFSYCK